MPEALEQVPIVCEIGLNREPVQRACQIAEVSPNGLLAGRAGLSGPTELTTTKFSNDDVCTITCRCRRTEWNRLFPFQANAQVFLAGINQVCS